jgi:hypothetical protein
MSTPASKRAGRRAVCKLPAPRIEFPASSNDPPGDLAVRRVAPAPPPRPSPSRKRVSRRSPSPPKTSQRAGGSRNRPNSNRTGSPRRFAREKALKEAEALTDPEERRRALAEIEALHPLIAGVTASNGSIALIRRV